MSSPTVAMLDQSTKALRARLQRIPSDLQEPSELRMISLKSLNVTLAELADQGKPLPDEVRYLGGLTRAEYIFLVPEQNDIVIAGPAEAWTINAVGEVVGQDSGRPVVLLDDLLVAMRSTEAARTVGITCSIDPTAEGRQALQAYLSKQKRFHPSVVRGAEQALGNQVITVTGVPLDSHFAGVLVASDYRMKRIAMMLEPAAIPGLPSFLEMLKNGNLKNNMPRWWMACDYDALARAEDGLAWQIRGRGVKVMTEDEFIGQDGSVSGTGRVNPTAQKWANLMTEKFDELSQVDVVFGQLRNIMDLSVLAALIAKEDLLNVAGCQLPMLLDGGTPTATYPVAKQVASQSSFVKRRREYIITASGGVQIDSWRAANETEVADLTTPYAAATTGVSTDRGWRW